MKKDIVHCSNGIFATLFTIANNKHLSSDYKKNLDQLYTKWVHRDLSRQEIEMSFEFFENEFNLENKDTESFACMICNLLQSVLVLLNIHEGCLSEGLDEEPKYTFNIL